MKNHKLSEVEILGPIFFVAKLTAMWIPTDSSIKIVRWYKFYLLCVIVSYSLDLTGRVMLLIFSKNFKDFADVFYMFLTELIILVKFYITIAERTKIFKLKTLLSDECCLASSEEEQEIRRQYDDFNRYFFLTKFHQILKSCSLQKIFHFRNVYCCYCKHILSIGTIDESDIVLAIIHFTHTYLDANGNEFT